MSGDFFIAGWRVQPAANRLQRGDQIVRVEPKVMQVLVCLAAEAGEVVTREALIARVWSEVHVTDDVLHRAVRELRRVFDDSSSSPRVIETIRKRGYRLMVPAAAPPAVVDGPRPTVDRSQVNGLPGQAQAWPHDTGRWWRMPAAAAALIAVLALVLAGLSIRKDSVTEAQARFVPLVSGPSNESDPAVAPDGVRLAYVVRDTANDQADIYLQPRPGASAERLTTHPADDRMPAWSPDGRRLAFVRLDGARCEIFVRSLDAASEQRIAGCLNATEPRLAWITDDSLVVSSIVDAPHGPSRLERLTLATGATAAITTAPPGTIGDHSPAVSPDGRSIAFIRHSSGGASDVFVVPSQGGAARRVTFDEADLTGVDWSARGRALVFSSDRAGGYSLWRVGVEGGDPQLVAGGAARLKHPVAARAVDRVAYESWNYEINLWEIGLGAGTAPARPVVSTSELWNLYPQLSPDGAMLAYVSTQSGTHELWLAAADGSARRQVTDFGSDARALARGTSVRAPRWSPDGRRVVFAAQRAGRVDIYVYAMETGTLVPLTADAAIEASPSWSADSRRVYYSVRDGARSNVWVRDAVAGSEASLAIADAVAVQAVGGALFFTRADRSGVFRLAADGSTSTLVVDGLGTGDSLSWIAVPSGVYFVAEERREIVLRRAPLTGGTIERITALPNFSWPGFSIDAGGTRLVYARWDRRESNIMAAESVVR